jgi:radical SAM superfamily enzyme YgiQ (UPF0313 family)
MKLLIVSTWRARYQGDERHWQFPALSAVFLAALCPKHIQVEVIHEQIRPVDPDQVDADLVAITSTTGTAPRMYELADRLRARGITVLLGGVHVSLLPEEALAHGDAIAIGEAELSFPQMLRDYETHRLQRVYRQPDGLPLAGMPIPRYDLFEDEFPLRCIVQATRGCPFRCRFCTLKAIDKHFRVRPTDEVIRDIQACEGGSLLGRKFVLFWDDNLTADHHYARELFTRLIPLRKWWWSQVSIDVAADRALLRLAAKSGCKGVFVGMESFSAKNLLAVGKRQNHVERYQDAVRAFHDAGIAIHAGIIVGLDQDDLASIREIPEAVAELGIDLPFINLLTPFPSTPLYHDMAEKGRLWDCSWQLHDGAHITYDPEGIAPGVLESTYWDIHHAFYSVPSTLGRVLRMPIHVGPAAAALNSYVLLRMMLENLRHPDQPWPEETLAMTPRQRLQGATPLNATAIPAHVVACHSRAAQHKPQPAVTAS